MTNQPNNGAPSAGEEQHERVQQDQTQQEQAQQGQEQRQDQAQSPQPQPQPQPQQSPYQQQPYQLQGQSYQPPYQQPSAGQAQTTYGAPTGQSFGYQNMSYTPMSGYGAPQQPFAQYQPLDNQQPQPLQQLTGGMKFGWFAVSLLLGIAGIILAWLINVDKAPQVKSDAIKWSAIGAVIGILISLFYVTVVLGGLMSMGASISSVGGFSW